MNTIQLSAFAVIIATVSFSYPAFAINGRIPFTAWGALIHSVSALLILASAIVIYLSK